jgi:hypothetical protein
MFVIQKFGASNDHSVNSNFPSYLMSSNQNTSVNSFSTAYRPITSLMHRNAWLAGYFTNGANGAGKVSTDGTTGQQQQSNANGDETTKV